MITIGKFNNLEVLREVDFGVYLDGGPYGDILLPQRYVPVGLEIGQDIEVFVYNDSEDRLIATTLQPLAEVERFAYLKVNDLSTFGAFLDWGLPKDLLVPFREQASPMRQGESYLVYVYLDETTKRIVATNRLNRLLKVKSEGFEVGQEVEIIVAQRTDLGYKVIVNETYWGLIFTNKVFRKIHIGDRLPAYVEQIRLDGKLDIVLQKIGYRQAIPEASQQLLAELKENEGFLPLTDKTAPEKIYATLKMSKKSFKKALGSLYKQKLIQLQEGGIRLVEGANGE
ncbi:MAG: GntR family transcriptional regulator [Bacteroidetes bacterium]|nr:GntR family transcriptional regulator [Bacteroidota bacterium]